MAAKGSQMRFHVSCPPPYPAAGSDAVEPREDIARSPKQGHCVAKQKRLLSSKFIFESMYNQVRLNVLLDVQSYDRK